MKMLIKDKIHGDIYLPQIIFTIINTPIFLRLKNIKQLGMLDTYYKEAIHTRYEHSIGTFHVARNMIDKLEKNSNNLIIPPFYKKCIWIAALLHDVGHGPFSHVWENINKSISHEKNAFLCIDQIFNEIPYKLDDDSIKHIYGISLIKALIEGKPIPVEKGLEFIFQIVSNKKTELDVDKLDYLNRDHHHLSMHLPEEYRVPIDFDDIFYGARVSDDRLDIEYQHTHYEKICKLFKARSNFFINWYQHPINLFIEGLLEKIFEHLRAHDEIELSDHYNQLFNGKRIQEIDSSDTDVFLNLTDVNVLNALLSINDSKISFWINAILDKKYEQFTPNKSDDIPPECIVDIQVRLYDKFKEDAIKYYSDPIGPKVPVVRSTYQKKVYIKYMEN